MIIHLISQDTFTHILSDYTSLWVALRWGGALFLPLFAWSMSLESYPEFVLQTDWASVLESDSEGALLLVQGLISTLEQEEHMVRSHVLENEQILRQTTSSVLEGMQQFLTRLQLRVKSSLVVSFNAGVAARHLLITKQRVSATGTPSQRRIMYHRAAAQTLKGTIVTSVEYLTNSISR